MTRTPHQRHRAVFPKQISPFRRLRPVPALVGLIAVLMAHSADAVQKEPETSPDWGGAREVCNRDGICDSLEDLSTCPIDCGDSLFQPWADPLRYFAFRYVTDDTTVALPIDDVSGLTRVEITIGNNLHPFVNTGGVVPAKASDANFQTSIGSKWVLRTSSADAKYYVGTWVVPPLTATQVLQKMNSRGLTEIPFYVLQYWNIEEIARAAGGPVPSVGVWMNADGTHKLDAEGKVQPPPDTYPNWPFDRYRSGQTMVWSRTYNDWPPPEGDPQRLYWNFHNPHVISYTKLFWELRGNREAGPGQKYLFCDNMYFHYGDIAREPNDFFPAGLTINQRAEMYAQEHLPILQYLTSRGFRLITNCLYRANSTGGVAFRNYINSHGAPYWATLFEQRFYTDCSSEMDKCRLVDPGDPRYRHPHDAGWHFLPYMQELRQLGKPAFFSINDLCASEEPCSFDETESRTGWELFLWVQLIANPGLTFVCNDTDLNVAGAPDFWWYAVRLGRPIGEAFWIPGEDDPDAGRWERYFESGHKIVFESGGRKWNTVPREKQRIYVERFY